MSQRPRWVGDAVRSGSAFDSFELAIIVSGDYRYDDPVDDTIVSVIVPGQANPISAAGALNLHAVTSGATTYPAASGIPATAGGLVPGSEGYLNISGTVTYSKTNKNSTTLTNPQGKILLKFASYNNQNGGVDLSKHSYQIQSNAIAGLTQLSNGRYRFTAKANVLDMTNSTTVDGGATLQITVDNAGLASVSLIGRSGTTWLSSSWNGTTTVLKPIVPGGSIIGQ